MDTYFRGAFKYRKPSILLLAVGLFIVAGIWIAMAWGTGDRSGQIFCGSISLLFLICGISYVHAFLSNKVTTFEISDEGISDGNRMIPWTSIRRLGIEPDANCLFFQSKGWMPLSRAIISDEPVSRPELERCLDSIRTHVMIKNRKIRFG